VTAQNDAAVSRQPENRRSVLFPPRTRAWIPAAVA